MGGKTVGGLTAKDLIKNKHGRVVSKKQSAQGKKSPWIQACTKARKALRSRALLSSRRAHHCTPRPRSSTTSERCFPIGVMAGVGKRRHQLQGVGMFHTC